MSSKKGGGAPFRTPRGNRRKNRPWVRIHGGCVVIIPPSIFTLALSLRRSRDFSQSLLRRLSLTAARPRVFCYVFIMLSL